MKKVTLPHFLALFFIFLLTFHAVRDHKKYTNYLRLIKSKEVLETAIRKLQKKNFHLKKEISKIKNSKSYALKVLRERYHLIEGNEKIIFFSE